MRRIRFALPLLLMSIAAPPALAKSPDFAQEAMRLEERTLADRRWLHEHAELSGREIETQAYLLRALTEIPGVELIAGEWGTGLVAILAGGKPGPTVAWRADMDGLPLREETGLPFACARTDTVSGNREVGVMHACGHDFHMAIGLNALRALAQHRGKMPGRVLYVSQPAEEVGAGAQQLLEAGVFDGGRLPKCALALHVHPTLDYGQIGSCPGPSTANVDGFALTVRGEGGHGAYPHRGIDPVTLAARIVLALQSIVSREIDVNSGAVISVGRIEGGAKSNVIPDEVLIEATVRSHDEPTRQALAEKIERTVKGLAMAAGAPEPDLQYYFGTAAGYNDPELVGEARAVFRRIVGEENDIQYEPQMGGEDFGYYGQRVPGFQFRLGVNPPGEPEMRVHRADFDPDERALRLGVEIAASLIWDQLTEK